MEIVVKIDVAELAGLSILSGAPSGREFFGKLVASLPAEPDAPEPLFLDFGKIQVATASFLRESILEFRNFVRGRKSNFYPVVANAASDIIDEIFELVQPRGDVIMTCNIGDDGEIVRSRHVGKLDPMQKLTFDLVSAQGVTTAAKLMESQAGDIKATAWNNRLASLSNLGLIYEQAQGRAKTYSSIFSGGTDGR